MTDQSLAEPRRDEPTVSALDRLAACRIFATVTIGAIEEAEPLAHALQDGGIRAIELTLRTSVALEAMRVLRQTAPRLLLGAGTTLTPDQAAAAQLAGAHFALAPGLDPAVVLRCAELGLPFVPGVATATEIQTAIRVGARWLKFFPAEALGGVTGLRALAAPFRHLGIRFLPLGGIDHSTLDRWLDEPVVAAVGGSWIAARELIEKGAWGEIRSRAATATARLQFAQRA